MRLSLLLVLGGLTGCYASHGRAEGEPDAEPPPPPPPPLLDASIAPDGGGVPECFIDIPPIEERVDAICINGGAIAGAPIPLELLLNVGHCGGQLPCVIEVDDEGREVAITTWHCQSADDCYVPPPLVDPSSCTLPALAPGIWHIAVNGSSGFDLAVSDPGFGMFEPLPTCWTLAEEPRVDESACEWPGSMEIDRACLPSEIAPRRPGVAVLTADCGCGNPAGPCMVTHHDGRIDVTMRFRDCGSRCRDTCGASTRECWLPPNLPVGTYELFVDGISRRGALTVGDAVDPDAPLSCI